MSNIHYAIKTEDGYATPVALLGAKSIECSYNVETSSISADDKVVHTISTLSEGEGTLEVLGLTGAEKRALFGGENEVGFGLGVDMKQPQMALIKQ